MSKFYEVLLVLKSPSDEAKETGFDELTDDIEEAIEYFNQHFYGLKRLFLIEAHKAYIRLILIMRIAPSTKVTAKELTVFSRYLYHEKNWKRFTREESKLFISGKIKELDDVGVYETLKELDREDLVEKIVNDDLMFYHDDVPEAEKDLVIEVDDMRIEEIGGLDKISDEQVISVMKYLFATRSTTLEEKERKKKEEAIKQIKKILLPWIV